jgi:hypothetical protein
MASLKVSASRRDRVTIVPGLLSSQESWIHLLRTDPVASFTALLFFATGAIWWATRGLVKGAEKTSERQLRAYVFIRRAVITEPFAKEGGELRLVIRTMARRQLTNMLPTRTPSCSMPPQQLSLSLGTLSSRPAARSLREGRSIST